MSNTITQAAIYPPLGIARVGNAPIENKHGRKNYYLAPEVPGRPARSEGGYKDSKGRVKKQAVRFRIYGLDAEGQVVRELTADDAKIEWTVHVANRKAAWYQFKNALDLEGLAIPTAFRNSAIKDPKDRSQLVIDPGPKKISGRSASGKRLDGGKFFDKEVPLGEIRTDDKGRLLFFGGDGHSASRDGAEAITFANNDGWHDDVSDGPIRAKVTFEGNVLEVKAAMVAVTPPNYGQGLFGVVTMYDVVYDLSVREGWIQGPEALNFWSHIFPILRNMTQIQWVNSGFFMLFGKNSPSDFLDPQVLDRLADPSPDAQEYREALFRWFRDPSSTDPRPAQIPPFYGDGFADYQGLAIDELAVTETQYGWLEKWARGGFSNEKPEPLPPFDEMTPAQQSESLTKAPLEECLGGPFHPGIELTWTLRNPLMWSEPFRLKVGPPKKDRNKDKNGGDKKDPWPKDDYGPLLAPAIALAPGGPLDGSGPGTLTRWLGIPWQTDEASCLSGYESSTYLPLPSFWAARVPNQVLSEQGFQRLTDPDLNIAQRLKHFDNRQDWLRDFSTQYRNRINSMVHHWWQLGIIAPAAAPKDAENEYLPAEYWVESQRPWPKTDPSFEQVLRAEGYPGLQDAAAMLAAPAGQLLQAAPPEAQMEEEAQRDDSYAPVPRAADRRVFARDER